jgi:hypothetical protein
MPSQQRLDQIRDLVNQWEQLVGYSTTVTDWMVGEMADSMTYGDLDHAITSLYDVGRYMSFHVGDPSSGSATWSSANANAMPWAKYGMSPTEYNRKLEEYDSGFRSLTGQAAPQDLVDRALHEHQGTMTMGQFETWLQTQESIKQQYGWLRYGLDFNQFQTQKLSMRTGFGRDLTDAEAVTQLQYHHAAQGGNVGVAAQQTLGQAEKKQAQTGLSGSVVR